MCPYQALLGFKVQDRSLSGAIEDTRPKKVLLKPYLGTKKALLRRALSGLMAPINLRVTFTKKSTNFRNIERIHIVTSVLHKQKKQNWHSRKVLIPSSQND